MAAIVLERVSKWRTVRREDGSRERICVLREVSLGVDEGQVLAIVGPSGAGKSTLLRLLNRLEDPDEGEILLDGTPLCELDVLDLRRRVGMVFQQPALFEGTVAENIAYGPRLRGRWRGVDEGAVRGLLHMVGLPAEYAARQAQELSVGEGQRVAIARALANEPEVLLLDEPTSALDPGAARYVLETIREINARLKLTVVMVSHTLEHAREVAQRAALLIGGKLVEEGPAEVVLQRPRTELGRRFVAGEFPQTEG